MSDRVSRVCLGLILCGFAGGVLAQPPALIHYQGRLVEGGSLVNGTVGLTLRLYNDPAAGALLLTDSNQVTVVDGLYNTVIGDTLSGGSLALALTNPAVYLEAEVNGTVLSPRERLMSVGYAAHAWGLSGNAGTSTGAHFIGTTDNVPLEFRVNNARVGRLSDASTAFGHPANRADGSGSSVAGGGSAFSPNRAEGSYNAIGGGEGNAILAFGTASAIAGGLGNVIRDSDRSAIGGGEANAISNFSFGVNIDGGSENRIVGSTYSVIGGGGLNALVDGVEYATIGGGVGNVLENNATATIGGGNGNRIGPGSGGGVIGGGEANRILTNAWQGTIAGGLGNEIGSGIRQGTLGGGDGNRLAGSAWHATIAGGRLNVVSNQWSAIGGGEANIIESLGSVIAGGYENRAGRNTDYATIGGGALQRIDAEATEATIGGGIANRIAENADGSTIGGGSGNVILTNANNAVIGGGSGNVAGNDADYSVMAGGAEAKTRLYGQVAHASGRFSEAGDAQASTYILRGITVGAQTNVLFLDGFSRRLTLEPAQTMTLDILVTASIPTGFRIGSYQLLASVQRYTQPAVTQDNVFVWSTATNTLYEDLPEWDVTLIPNQTNKSIDIAVTGSANLTCRWVAVVRSAEIIVP